MDSGVEKLASEEPQFILRDESEQIATIPVTYCGLFGIYPRWLQKFANSRIFILVYGFLGLVQAMAFIYMTVTLTTLEKRFKIPSQTTGLILSGNEISQILSIILMYYGGAGHRPKWLAVGVGLSAISCFILVIPHLIYGPGKAALALTHEHWKNEKLMDNSTSSEYLSLCHGKNEIEPCDNDEWSDAGLVPRFLVFFSQFVLGIGTTLYFGLGQTYMDDNSKKSSTPMLLGVTFALRTTGPALGFILAYFCMKLYIVPDLHPLINDKDPRWLGAWWLGWIILGLLLAIFAILIAMFPRHLPKKVKRWKKYEEKLEGEMPLNVQNQVPNVIQTTEELEVMVEEEHEPSIKGFLITVKRVISNKILLCNNLSAIFSIFGITPYMTFIAKYLEVQFNTSAAGGTLITGPIALAGMILGFFLSGYLISKFRPRPTRLLGWNVFGGLVFTVIQMIFIFNTCETPTHLGVDRQTMAVNFTTSCNIGCNCDSVKYSPVCHLATRTTIFSPCHAGCKKSINSKYFGNCNCVPEILNTTGIVGSSGLEQSFDTVSVGPCRGNCFGAHIIFVALSMIGHSLVATGKIGNVLVNYRCVEKKDKSVSQGVSLMFISLFALIPGPIFYGAIIDRTCLVWDDSCGGTGNCWYYDKDKLRYAVNLTGSVFTFIGALFDVFVCYLSRNLDLYGSNEEDKCEAFIQQKKNITSEKEMMSNN